ncbi:uncharacterized protein LOC142661626 [Rhinoderma darwinii]|uniref:uncharacterized protein LOC142661626 n=1 Tax=Rhinoderma darwinii TaxID=43563 RepID=UPI003F662541
MMMCALIVLSVIFSLASPGHSLHCVLCVALEGTHCSGNSVACPDGNICGSVYTETTDASSTQTSNVFMRSCIVEDQCNTTGSITSANVKVKTAISCCNTENCDPPRPIFTDDDHEGNGRICRSCSTKNSDWCYNSDTIECTGNETMCLLQITKLSGTVSLQTAIRGCTTRSICDRGYHRTESGGTRVDVEYVCTDDVSNLQQKSYISGLLALVLLNFLY